jgi:hypothetical protein
VKFDLIVYESLVTLDRREKGNYGDNLICTDTSQRKQLLCLQSPKQVGIEYSYGKLIYMRNQLKPRLQNPGR